MRRRVGMHPKPLGLENRPKKGDGRSLAVGSGNMEDRRQTMLGVSERAEQPLDAAKREVEAFRPARAKAVDDVERRFHGRGPNAGGRPKRNTPPDGGAENRENEGAAVRPE